MNGVRSPRASRFGADAALRVDKKTSPLSQRPRLIFKLSRGPPRGSRREVPDVGRERAVLVLETHLVVPLEEYVVVHPVAGTRGRGSLRGRKGRGGERSPFRKCVSPTDRPFVSDFRSLFRFVFLLKRAVSFPRRSLAESDQRDPEHLLVHEEHALQEPPDEFRGGVQGARGVERDIEQ